MPKVAENFRGRVVTWPRMLEVLDDYIEGVRPFSMDEEGHCLLRSGKNACAVGSFIPDEKYHPHLEGCSAESARILEVLELDDDVEPEHLDALQAFHDHAADLFGEPAAESCIERLKEKGSDVFPSFYTIARVAPEAYEKEAWKVVSKAIRKAQVLRRKP
jgi:hypothetical protein